MIQAQPAMMLFCTTVYVNGLPVDYCIHNNEWNIYEFEPCFNPHPGLEAPKFNVVEAKGAWAVDRIVEINVRDQALEALLDYVNHTK